eukprot:gnl/MRDRNA2_/MRDRNA2_24614_c0_seq1.p1 gnl/MRDRNA2_/MRDRNA2_24614_c0~~gnl/MRDRNA2_/MRDRNA2_24614_c0_seq1.p1  ORF type:complete len:452 (-),score=63.11 gnl/MRDRNA2_/MRDRNA2_24614_c0_seq1:373-1728(-)
MGEYIMETALVVDKRCTVLGSRMYGWSDSSSDNESKRHSRSGQRKAKKIVVSNTRRSREGGHSEDSVPAQQIQTEHADQDDREEPHHILDDRSNTSYRVAWEPSDAPEPPLQELPLNLLRDAGPPVKGNGDVADEPEVIVWDESRRCFAFHWHGLLSKDITAKLYDELLGTAPWEELKNKKGQVTRSTCWYTRGGCTCDYTYGDTRVNGTNKVPSESFANCMEDLTALIFQSMTPKLPSAHWPNSANLNYYADGLQSVGWHSDDERLFNGKEKDCPIVSLSLGARREFWIALKEEGQMEPVKESIIENDLLDGDLVSMEGLLQKHSVHFVAREPRQRAEIWPGRINVTWRWVVNHKRNCRMQGCQKTYFPGGLHKLGDDSYGWKAPAEVQIKKWWAEADPKAVEWRRCSGCRHDGWRGGRHCLPGTGRFSTHWFCRRLVRLARGARRSQSS